MAALLDNVPPSRTFDEMIKLLQTGHALASIVELRKLGLHRGVFPVLDVALDEVQSSGTRARFVQAALADTDARVEAGKPVAPSFMLAAMLWHDVQERWKARQEAGESSFPALEHAIDEAFDARIGDISGRGKLAVDMREIWMLQPRLERRASSSALALLEQPRFRAGLDFLRLRGGVGEADPGLAEWWESLYAADDDERRRLLESAREPRPPRRVPKPRPPSRDGEAPPAPRNGDGQPPQHDGSARPPQGDGGARPRSAADVGSSAASDDRGADTGAGEDTDSAATDPARRRRRRRRRPAGLPAGEGAPSEGGGSGNS
jgi:poly(A) polymerase